MRSCWPTAHAKESLPVLAEHMNNLPKVVFSRTLEKISWNNTAIVRGDITAAVRQMKSRTKDQKDAAPGMTILGSASLISQLAQEGLIDEF